MIQMIPLNKLTLSPNNVRKTDTEQLIAEFADNIETRGVLQNLVAVPSGKGFNVIVGGRRLRALTLLKDRKAIKANHPVPVAVIEAAREEQAEISLIENVIRQQMTVADEIRAYKFFINEGSDLDAIAKRFGRTRRAVEGRLRLADLAEPIFAALERGEITLDVAKAYATTSNHDRQILVWDQIHDSWQGNNADAIRRMITNSSINSTSPIARLVTEAAYLAAGGRIERDNQRDRLLALRPAPALSGRPSTDLKGVSRTARMGGLSSLPIHLNRAIIEALVSCPSSSRLRLAYAAPATQADQLDKGFTRPAREGQAVRQFRRVAPSARRGCGRSAG